ncbi:MAG: DUF4012 domain-containing protein [Patescibacteria group bacterium]
MPESKLQFTVSTAKVSAAIFPSRAFPGKTIAKYFRKQGIKIKRAGLVDYVVDCLGNPEAISLAQKHNAKYLRIIVGSGQAGSLGNLNWRVIRTDYLVGKNMDADSFLGQLISSSISNQTLQLSGSPSSQIFPLSPQDLAEAAWQSLIMPATNGKEFLILGPTLTLQELAEFLQTAGQTNQGIQFNPAGQTNQYHSSLIRESKDLLSWEPKVSWQQSLDQAFAYFWKKLQPEKRVSKQVAPEPIGQAIIDQAPIDQAIIEPPQPIVPTEKKPQLEENEDEPILVETSHSLSDEAKSQPKQAAPIPSENPPPVDKRQNDEKRLEEIIAHFSKSREELNKPVPRPTAPTKTSRIKTLFSGFLLILLLISAILGIAWIRPGGYLLLAAVQLQQGLGQSQKYNWDGASTSIGKSKKYFSQAEKLVENQRAAKLVFLGQDKLLGKIAELGNKGAIAAETALPLMGDYLELSKAIFTDSEFDLKTQLPKIKSRQEELLSQLSMLEALLSSPWQELPKAWRQKPKYWAQTVKESRLALGRANQLIDQLPWLIGSDNQRRTFLVLLQNNMELRPTGGFIGSFALLTFEDGSLSSLDVKDVYAADGQLKGHVEPPPQIKEILGEESWYLRDANWNPDFPKSARNVEWFLTKELGREVDGVIAINLETAKKLVGAFGEIYLPDFDEKISANNLFERAEFWSEKEFFPGSTQKMAFLGVLSQQLFENIKAAKPEEQVSIAKAFLESLEEKETLIYVHQENLAQVLNQLNWDGSIKKPKCSLPSCLSDYLFLVEANLGVNKANYFLNRSLEQLVILKENGSSEHKLKINYENTATSTNWPGGNYTNWLRIHLPIGSQINKISIYDPQNPGTPETIGPEQREESIVDGKEVIGLTVRVPIKQRRTVEVDFSQKGIGDSDNLAYLLYWQKQSGYRSTPVSLAISFPTGWQPLQVNPAANLVGNQLIFNYQLDSDLNFGVEFNR